MAPHQHFAYQQEVGVQLYDRRTRFVRPLADAIRELRRRWRERRDPPSHRGALVHATRRARLSSGHGGSRP